MANDPKKKPTPPKKQIPDYEQTLSDADLFADEIPQIVQPESEVDLGRASGGGRPKPPSGQSSGDWAETVRPPSGGSTPPKFDSPSDAELIGRVPIDPPERTVLLIDDEDALDDDGRPDPESSRVNLFDQPPAFDPLQSRAVSGPVVQDVSGLSVESVDSAVPVGGAMLIDSGIDLGSGVVEVEDASARSSSGIDLGSHHDLEIPEVISGAVPIDSGIDIGSAAVIDVTDADSPQIVESGIDLGGAQLVDSSSALALGGAVVIDDEADASELKPDSASDIFVGADDSGSNVPSAVDETIGLDDVDLGGAVVLGGTASSVNLDELPSKSASSRDLIAEAVESGVDLTAMAGVVDDEDAVVLEGGSGRPGDSSSAIDLGAAVLVEDDQPVPDIHLEMIAAPVEDSEEEMTLGGAEIVDEDPTEAVGGAEVIDDETAGAELIDDEEQGTLFDDGEGLAVVPKTDEDGLAAEDEVVDVEDGIAPDSPAEEAAGEGSPFADEVQPVAEGDAEVEAEPEEEPAPVKRRGTGLAWVGGLFIGGVMAAAATMGVVVFNEDVPKQVKELIGLEDENPSAKKDGKGNKGGGGPTKEADLREMIDAADFNAEPPPIDEDSGDKRALRGEFRWLKLLSKGQPPKEESPELKAALDDLKTASDKGNTSAAAAANAFFWQGHIQETLNKRDEAAKIYRAAAERYKTDPDQKARFEGAIDRLDIVQPVKAAPMGGKEGAMLPTIDYHPFALLLVVAQEQPKKPTEAGYDFWKAMKLAGEQKYGEAITAIDKARANHEARRLERIRKPQNPESDPAEQIFLKSCDELKAFWTLQDRLKKENYLTDKQPDLTKAVNTIFEELKAGKTSIDDLKTEREDRKKEKKESDDKIKMLGDDLAVEKKAKEDALTLAAETKKQLDASKELAADGVRKLADATASLQLLGRQKKALEETIIGVGDIIGLKDIDPVLSKNVLDRKLRDVVNVASTIDRDRRIMADLLKIRDLESTLKNRWSPEIMLGLWTPLLTDRTKKTQADDAITDAVRVRERAEPKPTLEERSHSFAVEGLALRNKGEFAKAREALTEALRGDVAGPAWKPIAKDVLAELSDPAASYLPRARDLHAKRRLDDALAVLDEAAKVFGDKAGTALALRSRIRLEKIQNEVAKPTPTTPGMKEAFDDAEAAQKTGAPGEGLYAAAAIAEASGQLVEAEQLYRRAATALPLDHPDSIKAKLAVSRLLLQGVEAKPAPEPMPKTSRLPGIKLQKFGHARIPNLAALVTADLPSPEEEAKIKEAIRLADEVLAGKDIDQFPLLKAQALAVKGLWTEALNTYVKGLAPHLSKEHHDGLKYLVDNHPMQRRGDALRIPHPMQAQKHYAQGLTRFHERKFEVAEKEFEKAIQNFELDARYHYFLGLSRLAQGKRTAAEDFERGAALEIDNRPSSAAVNAALERIQRTPRRIINDARERVR